MNTQSHAQAATEAPQHPGDRQKGVQQRQERDHVPRPTYLLPRPPWIWAFDIKKTKINICIQHVCCDVYLRVHIHISHHVILKHIHTQISAHARIHSLYCTCSSHPLDLVGNCMFQDLVKLIRTKAKEILVLFAESGLSNVV